MHKNLLTAFCLLFVTHLSYTQTWFTTGQSADLMVSGVDFNQTGGIRFNHPNGLATDGDRLLVCDRFNNRILIWNALPTTADAQPDLVLGQPDFTSNDPGNGKHQLNWAGNVSVSKDGHVAAADTENDRILIWNHFPTTNGQAADVSLYLPDLGNPGTGVFYGWPWGVWTDGTRLAAVATGGGALLFWNTMPVADNTKPDYVIKLQQFGTPRNISTDGSTYFFVGDHNAKVTGNPGTFFWNSYPATANQTYDFYRDEWIKGEKLPDGKLVAGGLQSIYIWNTMPTQAAQNPDLTLTPAMYKNGDGVDVAFAQNRLFVNNYNGNDVLVFNEVPESASQLPDFAITSPSIGAQTLDSIFYTQNPVLVTDGQRLIATSDFDRAIYIWDQFPEHSGQHWDHRIGMPQNVPLWGAALHHGHLITGARNSLSVWNNVSQISATPSYQLHNNIGTALLDDIRGVALDDQYTYIATRTGKLYIWEGLPATTSQNPVLTLNSSGPYGYLYSDGEYLCAARPEPPTGVDIYRISDLAAGVTTPYKVVSSGQVRINQASQAITFDGALAVASRGDHRVLLWEKPADWGLPGKEVVLGQSDTQHFDAAIGVDHLFMPNALLSLPQTLWVGEFKFSSRILKFTYGASATQAPDWGTLRVYPNPVHDQLTLDIPGFSGEKAVIRLYNTLGQLVKTEEMLWSSTGVKYQIQDCPAGAYLLQVSTDRAVFVAQVIRH